MVHKALANLPFVVTYFIVVACVLHINYLYCIHILDIWMLPLSSCMIEQVLYIDTTFFIVAFLHALLTTLCLGVVSSFLIYRCQKHFFSSTGFMQGKAYWGGHS